MNLNVKAANTLELAKQSKYEEEQELIAETICEIKFFCLNGIKLDVKLILL